MTGWSVIALISSCKAWAKVLDAPALITTTPSLVMIKLRLLLCPVFSYVGGPVAPMADHTFGIYSIGLDYKKLFGNWSLIFWSDKAVKANKNKNNLEKTNSENILYINIQNLIGLYLKT